RRVPRYAAAGPAVQPSVLFPGPTDHRLRQRRLIRGSLLGLLPLLSGLTRGAHPGPQQHDALRVASERPRHHLVGSAPRATFDLLTGLDLAGKPGDLGLHARDYTRIRA